MVGDHDRFAAAMKINMFGQMPNLHYVGPSFTYSYPDDVLEEFEIGIGKA